MNRPSLRNYIKQRARQHTVVLLIGASGENFSLNRKGRLHPGFETALKKEKNRKKLLLQSNLMMPDGMSRNEGGHRV